jgi:hypothetical protein
VAIEFLDHHERKHNVVFFEAQRRVRVGKQYTGVENVRLQAHGLELLSAAKAVKPHSNGRKSKDLSLFHRRLRHYPEPMTSEEGT